MANIVRWEPFRELTDFRDTADRLFYHGRTWRVATLRNPARLFPVDVYETKDDVVVKASLPGVKAGEVDVSVTGDTLVIKGETSGDKSDETPSYYRQERRSGSFQRALTLPVEIDADGAAATFEDGVLELRLPKAASERSKTIEVKAATNGK